MKTKAAEKLLEEMIQTQLSRRGITDQIVLDAFHKVYRHFFVSKGLQDEAYEDYPLDIGFGQTISQPYIVALTIQSAKIKANDKVLEIGTGSGYQTAILAEIAKEVYTIEIIKTLSDTAEKTLKDLGYENIRFLNGNGYLGWLENAPYDKIIVSAAAKYLPSALVEQLVGGGHLIIPLDIGGWQELLCLTKEEFALKREKLCDCRFVPLIEKLE